MRIQVSTAVHQCACMPEASLQAPLLLWQLPTLRPDLQQAAQMWQSPLPCCLPPRCIEPQPPLMLLLLLFDTSQHASLYCKPFWM